MRKILIIILSCFFLSSHAQSQDSIQTYYKYLVVGLTEKVWSDYMNIIVDDGITHGEVLKDENGKRIKCKSIPAIIMYFNKQGWELIYNNNLDFFSSYNGTGSTKFGMIFTFRKRCSKEEFDEILQKSIIKK
ncbi:MAG: hypothetical protein IKT22_07805 [Prevotella sp.]|nr:hypothetical protein [Prevotella sp.]MBR6495143.1 hypothetical protein [Prevotella sp.]